jgi:hypothetical protein
LPGKTTNNINMPPDNHSVENRDTVYALGLVTGKVDDLSKKMDEHARTSQQGLERVERAMERAVQRVSDDSNSGLATLQGQISVIQSASKENSEAISQAKGAIVVIKIVVGAIGAAVLSIGAAILGWHKS